MTDRHAICLVVDGLRASALGAYGNTTYPTPQFDVLASRALVADWLWVDSPHLADFYRSAWHGKHALRPQSDLACDSILNRFQQAGVRQWLVTDDAWLTKQAGQLPFDETLLFENDAVQAAAGLEDTALGFFFAEAIEHLHQWREDVAGASSLAWLHSRGFYGPWDAPVDLRANFRDDEDPPVMDIVQPPAALHNVDDPDELLAYRVAYAAQVSVLDACVGAFVQAVEDVFAGCEALIIIMGARGFALGEHRSIGSECTELYGELLHVPWFVYPCRNVTPLPRWDSLAQSADVGATLLDWLGVDPNTAPTDGISLTPGLVGDQGSKRQLAIAHGAGGELALRTPAWMLTQKPSEAEPFVELFTKPDDRWESNNVAALCPEVVDGLCRELDFFQACCQQEKALPLIPQDEELILPLR